MYMKALRRMLLTTAVATAAGLFVTTARASAADWSFGYYHPDDHGHCVDMDHHHDDGHHDAKSVPEIDPNGLTAMACVLAGGIALITARRRRIIN
jgi:hypothetical protein